MAGPAFPAHGVGSTKDRQPDVSSCSNLHDTVGVWQSGITLTTSLVENFARHELGPVGDVPIRSDTPTSHYTATVTASDTNGRRARTDWRTEYPPVSPSWAYRSTVRILLPERLRLGKRLARLSRCSTSSLNRQTGSLLFVTGEPAGLRLPTREVVPPKGLWRFVIIRVLAVAALGFIMAAALNHSSRGMIAATAFLAVMFLIAAVEVPLFKRRWRRLEQQRLASLPGDAIYAGPARAQSLQPGGGSRPVAGEIVLDGHGFSFTPRRATDAPPLNIAWAEMAHIQLLPISAAPVAGSLVLSLRGGSTQNFVVQRCESLADKLQHLPERL